MKFKISRYKAQNSLEMAILSVLALAICMACLILFKGQLIEVLDLNHEIASNNASRTLYVADAAKDNYTTMKINGLEVTLSNGFNSDTIGTSGADGLVVMLNRMLDAIKAIQNSSLSNINKSDYIRAMLEYGYSSIALKASNGMTADDPARNALQQIKGTAQEEFNSVFSKMDNFREFSSFIDETTNSLDSQSDIQQALKALETSIDVNKDGTRAIDLLEQAEKLDDSTLLDQSTLNLVEEFTNNVVDIGSSLELRIDSRLVQKLDEFMTVYNEPIKTTITELDTKIDSLISSVLGSSYIHNISLMDDISTLKDLITSGDLLSTQTFYSQMVADYGLPAMQPIGTKTSDFDDSRIFGTYTGSITKTRTLEIDDNTTVSRVVYENLQPAVKYQDHYLAFKVNDTRLTNKQIRSSIINADLVSRYGQQSFNDFYYYLDMNSSAIYLQPYTESLNAWDTCTYVIPDEFIKMPIDTATLLNASTIYEKENYIRSVLSSDNYIIYNNDPSVDIKNVANDTSKTQVNTTSSTSNVIYDILNTEVPPLLTTETDALKYMLEFPDQISSEFQLTTEEIKQIIVYSEGNLNEILPESYDPEALCENVFNGTIYTSSSGLSCNTN